MKNIFSKTTENRTQNGVKSYLSPTFVLYTISIFAFLTLGVGNVWADITYSGGHIYFDNSLGIDDNTLQICARQVKSDGGTYTGVSSLSNISNTKLYYVANPQGSNWGNIAGWVVISANPAKSNSNFDNWSDYTWCSGWNTYGFNSGSTYLIVPSSKDKNQSVTTTYCDGGYGAIPKYNATQGAKWRDAGTSYAITTGTYPATLKLQGTYLSGDGKSTRSTITSTASTDGDEKKVYGAVVTGEITHSFESLNSSYYFEGWGTGSTPSSTENTYSYNISENTTTYAFFSKKYTLTYDRKGTFGNSTLSVDVSNFSGTKESGSAIPTGHQITFTATPASGYVIEGWYSDEACTVSLDNGQNPTYTISSLDADKSVYVKFEQLKTITIKFAHEAKDGWTIQGVRRYPESGEQRISANGKWVTIEFTNVYAVSNIDLAYSGGDWDYLNTATKITGDCCYNRNGSLNASCCVQPANPTWGTAPANGAIGGSMTASVSGAPEGATITWSSTNTSAATVNSSGVISYVAAGNTTIKARVTWIESGDYCAGSYELSQEISVTSGAMVSVERTCPEYVSSHPGQVKLDISSTGASTGWSYRVCNSEKTAYYTPEWQSAASNTLSWTMAGALPPGSNTLVVELYNSDRQLVCTSNPVTVNVEIAELVTISAGANGSVSPSGTVYANNNHVHPTITATPNEHYHFVNWTSNNAAASVADANSATTTVTATASGYTITANFAGDEYTITYKDQGGVDYSGNNEGSLPATHTYGTATDLVNGTKEGFTFDGWYTDAECTGEAVTSIGATAYTNDITLYAKWGKNPSLTRLDLSTSVVTTGNTFTATPTIDAGDGRTTNVCWAVKNSSDEEVSTTITPIGGNAVTITAPAAPGKYKVVATLREGNDCGGTVLNSLQQPFTVEGRYSVTITNGVGSSFVGEETTATVTANAAEAGMKFDHWEVTGTITKYTSGDENSRVITFNASSEITLTAVYTDRDSKTVYFAKPSGWTDGLKVYAWEEATKDGKGNPSNKNVDWPGVECTSTKTEKGTTYYSYTYYIDDNGEGDDKTAQERWDKIIFNDNGYDSKKTKDLTLVDGHFYHIADGSGENGRDIVTVSGSTSAEDWYVCGYWDQSTHDWGFAHPVDLNGSTSGSVVVTVTASRTQEFKIYRASTNEWFKWTGGPSANYNDNYPALIGDPMTLRIYNLNRNTFTSYATEYRFTLDITNPSNPVLTLTPNDNTPYSATLSKNGHGSLSVGTGAITLRKYIPTTITATPEPGYRFTGWTTTGSVAFAGGTSSSNATASFTATDNGGTITANFSNSEVIYFDASGVSDRWGDEVYVTFFSHDFEWNNGNGALIVKNWVDNALYCVEMTRIPNTDIYYLDYSNLSGHERVTQYVLFTSKHFVHGGENNYYQLFEMAAVTRGDYAKNTTNNLFVAEDWLEKDKNKTGYYVGYWMNYKQTDPGVYLDIHDGGSQLQGIPNFQLIDGSENEYTATYTLSGNNTFKLGLRGANGTYYNNDRSGTMTFSNCTGWSYVDRQKTPGGISTTADGEYKFTLTCGDKLTLSVEYPLSVGDYRIIYQGALEDTTSAPRHDHPSKIIRQLSGGATERKDTVSFFVTGDWSITLQKCTSVAPNITWKDACGSATKDAEALGLSGKTGVYVFPLTLSSTGGDCDQITVGTPELYTGDYYIRTDVAKGGWEGYTRSLDNRMTYSDYAKHNSGFDYYNCQYAQTNKNVKFTIANDYSFCITDTLEGDAYVPKAGANIGKLPYQANIRFMYNSAKNTISRAYLNGSSETGENTFLYLQSTSNASEPDIYQSDGSDLVDNTIRFNDHNNWIYQIDIQANEQARVKLISNYRFNSTDHLQYFKGTDGDWSEATTSEIIGGNYSSHPNERHALRIIYDFKTNHLLSAWLVPESGSVPAAAINTNVMIIKQNQEDARQITFSSGNDALTEVDTVYTAVLLTKEFLTGGASEYAKQFYWVSFPYTVKINDIFGSVGTYGYDWILQRYNGKKRAANGFWIDSEPNWEFMDKSETLNPYEGYILTLDLGEFTSGSLKWNNNVTYLSLYFPSDSKVGNIKQKNVTVEYDQTGYACTITRDNRNIKDSYWRCIGSPSFAENTIGGWNRHENTDDTWKTENLPFLYEWNSETNQLSPVAAGENYTFKPLTGYMVQYSGESLNWTNVVTPSVSAPKRQNSAATDLTYKLQLVRGEEEVDHTFVRFSDDENITAAFEFNQDLSKEFKSGANIYTLTSDQIQVAGNSLPLSTTQTVVPVGVKIKTAGDYTFSIPEGTDGIGVTLVDNETGVRTLLSALDYTVNLAAGDYTERFWLEISPIYNTPTGIEDPTSDSSLKGRAQKRIIDGVLYIVKDGKIFDARGTRVE